MSIDIDNAARAAQIARVKPLKVEDIPEAGLELDEPLELDFLSELLPDNQELAPKGPGTAKLSVQKLGSNITLSGQARAEVRCLCASCLCQVELALNPKIKVVLFKQKPEELSDSDAELNAFEGDDRDPGEGEGTGEYDGKVVDWPAIVREQLLLALPIAPRCKEDCKGLCPVCGSNRNQSQCSCETKQMDPRWEKLKLVKLDGN